MHFFRSDDIGASETVITKADVLTHAAEVTHCSTASMVAMRNHGYYAYSKGLRTNSSSWRAKNISATLTCVVVLSRSSYHGNPVGIRERVATSIEEI